MRTTSSVDWMRAMQVQVLGQEGDWIQIEYDGQTGYVYSGLLQ